VKAQDRYLPSFWTRASYPRPPNKGSHENQAILPLAITMMAGLQIMSAVLLVGADTNRKETQI
jgi:small neutral amino acid transporter SnatA (MarC family)